MKKICYVVTVSVTIRSFFIPQLKYLADNGFDVTVICSNDKRLQEELGQKVHYLPVDIPRGISLKGTLNAICLLYKIFNKQKYDIVQYSTPNAAFCASVAALLARIKTRNYHLMGFRYMGNKGASRLILKALEKITCSCSTNIECVSESNCSFGAMEKLYPKGKATVVWNGSTGGVDLVRFDSRNRLQWRKEIRQKCGISDRDFVFGFVGRITRDKGVNELLESFFQLHNAKLLLIGNKEGITTLNSRLWEKAQEHAQITIVDWVTDIEKYYAAMDVLVLPSYREGFGNVIIEAASVGTSTIASDISGPKDVIDNGKTGLLCNARDCYSLLRCMQQVMEDQRYIKLGENAEKYAKDKYDSQILCEHILHRKQNLLMN